ncbi:MAG: hypothetical protein ACKOPT_09970, partial [Cyanobium sp.]
TAAATATTAITFGSTAFLLPLSGGHIGGGRDGAASVLIRPAAPGTGVIAGGSIRTVLELAGIKNVLAKRLGSKTPLNNARAAMDALSALRTHKEAARERGIPLEQIYS